MSNAICERLNLDVVSSGNTDAPTTPFTLKIDARYGITTGTSAFDRARTVAVAIDDNSTPNDLVRGKGHVDGLRAKDGGVLVRAGHTEGSVDLARLAGLRWNRRENPMLMWRSRSSHIRCLGRLLRT